MAGRRIRIAGEEIDGLRALVRAKKLKEKKHDPSIEELRAQLALVVSHLQRIDPTFCFPAADPLCGKAHSDSNEESSTSCADGRISK